MFLIYIKNILGKEELRENVVSQQRLSSPKDMIISLINLYWKSKLFDFDRRLFQMRAANVVSQRPFVQHI